MWLSLLSARWRKKRSTEFIQKQEASDEDCKWNPEVDIGDDHAEQIAGSGGSGLRLRHFRSLIRFSTARVNRHLRHGAIGSQRVLERLNRRADSSRLPCLPIGRRSGARPRAVSRSFRVYRRYRNASRHSATLHRRGKCVCLYAESIEPTSYLLGQHTHPRGT